MSSPLLFVIGDSISIQYGPYLEAMVQPHWRYGRKSGEEEALRNLDVPTGANGGDSSMVRTYLEALAAEGKWKPDRLLLNCGLHDIKTDDAGNKQVPLDAYEENLRAIADVLKRLGVQTVWVRTTPVDDETHNSKAQGFRRFARDVDAYNAAADAVWRDAGVPLADLHAFTAALGEGVFCDHVHFIEDVRAKQAAFLAGFVDALRQA